MNALYGLVLAGGKSLRMGKDKGQIHYRGMPHSLYLLKMVEDLCDKAFLSIRSDQKAIYDSLKHKIVDEDLFKGPFNGMMSAYHYNPEVSWLVVACDLPLMDKASLEMLIAERDANMAATAMATHKTGLPEPLAAIWEAHSLKTVPDYLKTAKSSCPRKFLLNSDTKLVFPEDDTVLLNSNSEQDYEEVMKRLSAI